MKKFYFDSDFNMVENEKDASMVKIIYPDGRREFLKIKKPGAVVSGDKKDTGGRKDKKR